jgi:hypothetical protein
MKISLPLIAFVAAISSCANQNSATVTTAAKTVVETTETTEVIKETENPKA